MNHAILLISCPDKKGITAAVTGFITRYEGNILHADQHIDAQSNTFFMRVVWDLKDFTLSRDNISDSFRPMALRFGMEWYLSFSDDRLRMAIFVSKPQHCLVDLLYRYKSGQMPCEIPLIISNHPDAGPLAREYGIPFFEFTVLRENKADQEMRQIALLAQHHIDIVVLARYHQILTPEFVRAYPQRIINIHHSFLPAFAGSNPYGQAYDKGVKVIGATSHYVTDVLDEGPIIEQDTVRISHRDDIEALKRKGEDLERTVLQSGRAMAFRKKDIVLWA